MAWCMVLDSESMVCTDVKQVFCVLEAGCHCYLQKRECTTKHLQMLLQNLISSEAKRLYICTLVFVHDLLELAYILRREGRMSKYS